MKFMASFKEQDNISMELELSPEKHHEMIIRLISPDMTHVYYVAVEDLRVAIRKLTAK